MASEACVVDTQEPASMEDVQIRMRDFANEHPCMFDMVHDLLKFQLEVGCVEDRRPELEQLEKNMVNIKQESIHRMLSLNPVQTEMTSRYARMERLVTLFMEERRSDSDNEVLAAQMQQLIILKDMYEDADKMICSLEAKTRRVIKLTTTIQRHSYAKSHEDATNAMKTNEMQHELDALRNENRSQKDRIEQLEDVIHRFHDVNILAESVAPYHKRSRQ
jgi:hypothetical protein